MMITIADFDTNLFSAFAICEVHFTSLTDILLHLFYFRLPK